MTLEEAYNYLGLQPIIDFEQSMALPIVETGGLRRTGITTQTQVECMLALIEHEAETCRRHGSVTTTREDDFVIVCGPGSNNWNLQEYIQGATFYYRMLGGTAQCDSHGPENLWVLNWNQRKRLRGVPLDGYRFFFDPWNLPGAPTGPFRLIKHMRCRILHGKRVYEALDDAYQRVALMSHEQAKWFLQRTIRPVRFGGVWVRPRMTHP